MSIYNQAFNRKTQDMTFSEFKNHIVNGIKQLLWKINIISLRNAITSIFSRLEE